MHLSVCHLRWSIRILYETIHVDSPATTLNLSIYLSICSLRYLAFFLCWLLLLGFLHKEWFRSHLNLNLIMEQTVDIWSSLSAASQTSAFTFVRCLRQIGGPIRRECFRGNKPLYFNNIYIYILYIIYIYIYICVCVCVCVCVCAVCVCVCCVCVFIHSIIHEDYHYSGVYMWKQRVEEVSNRIEVGAQRRWIWETEAGRIE